ncbi:MAG: FAD-binding protein [Jiangellaceae bacterium]
MIRHDERRQQPSRPFATARHRTEITKVPVLRPQPGHRFEQIESAHAPLARRQRIVRPANANEVSRVVSFARETGLELAVRSGGHSGAGHSTTDGRRRLLQLFTGVGSASPAWSAVGRVGEEAHQS